MPKRALRMNRTDNVATLLETAEEGEEVVVLTGKQVECLVAAERIPFNFKIALSFIPKGQSIIKYGEIIGEASIDISQGTLVHLHNLAGRRGRGDLKEAEQL